MEEEEIDGEGKKGERRSSHKADQREVWKAGKNSRERSSDNILFSLV
jgi:hypothetical protein